MVKKYLVTGGSGFIGRAIVESLLKKKNKVIVVDNNFRKKKYNIIKDKNLITYKIDIRNKKKLKKIFKGIDTVIHLAFINGTNYFYQQPELVLNVALEGMLNVIDLSKDAGVKEFFLASSSEVYHEAKKIPTSEKVSLVIPDPKNPRYSYAAGKIISEIMLLNTNFFKKAVIFRPHNIYGPDMGNKHVIPEIIYKLAKSSKSITIQGKGEQTRAFCYISDFVKGFNILLSKGKNKNIYNIGTDNEIEIIELIRKIIDISEKKVKIKTTKEKLGGTNRRCPDISKIKKIGYSSKIKLNDGLLKTYKWYIKDINNEI